MRNRADDFGGLGRVIWRAVGIARLAAVAAIVACSGAGAPQSARDSQGTSGGGAPQSSGTLTVLIEGTSLTAGLGLDPDQAYPALLQRKIDSTDLPFTVKNAGLSGETSAGALRRLDWLLGGPVDVFVLETGANDGLRGLDVDSVRANIEALIRGVKRMRPLVRICLVQMEAPTNLGPAYTRPFHDLYPAIARAEGVTLLPFLLDGVAGQAALNQADGIHPNVQGERIVAATMWRGLEPVLRAEAAARINTAVMAAPPHGIGQRFAAARGPAPG
jgi:acyl-CoA thioesterase-1